METSIIVFGRLADIIGNNNIVVTNSGNTDSLMKELKQLYPELDEIKFLMAVDKKTVTENTFLNSSNIIALLPPFSGG